MSINRIDFQGAFMRTGDQHNVKAADNSRVNADQNIFQNQFEKEREEKSTSVIETTDANKSQGKFDAREKGKNEYHDGRKKDKKGRDDKESELEGAVLRLGGQVEQRVTHTFDLNV